MARTLSHRDETPLEDQWAVESIFPTEEAFDEAFARLDAELPALAGLAGTLGASAGQLLAALKARDEAQVRMWHLGLYAHMRYEVDQTNQANQARFNRAMGLDARFNAAIAFIEPELLALPAGTLDEFMRAEPGLAIYRHYLDQLALRRGHVRSAEVEEVLAQAAEVAAGPYLAYEALTNADLTFARVHDEQGDEVELTQGNSDILIGSAVRGVRRAAWQAYADGHLSVKNTLAATLAGAIKSDVFAARVHGYSSAREATLHPHNIPVAVFDNLIATVRAHLPLWHRYWAIRRRALGVAELHPYDVDVPLAIADEAITYERGVELLLEGLAPLGDEYVGVARRGLTAERWVDKYPNLGKGSGAHSTAATGYGTRPFINMNYDDTLLSLSTLSHEMGHSMHSWYTWRQQPPVYAGYSMFIAETASNFNQALLRPYLLARNADRRFQVAVIEEGMANFLRYFFIMPILAQFELEMHQRVERGEPLTADSMSAALVTLYAEGYGGEVVMDEPRVGIIWAEFPHLFGNFYVWQYATGIAAANSLAADVLAEGAPAVERYLRLLQAGDALYPIEALRLAGVNMTGPEPIERAFKVLEDMIDRLDALVGEGPFPWLPAQEQ